MTTNKKQSMFGWLDQKWRNFGNSSSQLRKKIEDTKLEIELQKLQNELSD